MNLLTNIIYVLIGVWITGFILLMLDIMRSSSDPYCRQDEWIDVTKDLPGGENITFLDKKDRLINKN